MESPRYMWNEDEHEEVSEDQWNNAISINGTMPYYLAKLRETLDAQPELHFLGLHDGWKVYRLEDCETTDGAERVSHYYGLVISPL